MNEPFHLRPASEYPAAAIADLFNLAFTGYVVPVRVGPGLVTAWTKSDSLEIGLSRVLLRGDIEIGIALIARRGWTSRIAAFAIEPESRGQGAGHWMMERLMEEARDRGDRALVLECIEQNPVAVRFYGGFGFRTERRLVGYTADRIEGAMDAWLTEVDPAEVGQRVGRHVPTDLPWQLSAPTLVQSTPPGVAYRLGSAYTLLSDPGLAQIYIRGLIVAPEERRQGWATLLLRALSARYPDRIWKVSPIWPEEIAPEFFRHMGFDRDVLSQLQMRRVL